MGMGGERGAPGAAILVWFLNPSKSGPSAGIFPLQRLFGSRTDLGRLSNLFLRLLKAQKQLKMASNGRGRLSPPFPLPALVLLKRGDSPP